MIKLNLFPYPAHLAALVALVVFADSIPLPSIIHSRTTVLAAAADIDIDDAAAADVGVVRQGSDASDGVDESIVSIDFDVPRYGPLCISIDERDVIEFVWDEYHNLNSLPNENSYRECDFSEAVPLVPDSRPNPLGYRIEAASSSVIATTTTAATKTIAVNDVRYFSCSKICRSNGHKVKVCAGGVFGEPNECYETLECAAARTVDMRRRQLPSEGSTTTTTTIQAREYVPVGKVCRPKNGDGYSIASGIDTPESCKQKCDEDATKCGAWEFENYDGGDNRECELHELDAVSYDETVAMEDCQIPISSIDDHDGDYRCCWIVKDIVDLQTTNSMDNNDNDINATDNAAVEQESISTTSGSVTPTSGSKIALLSIAIMMVDLLRII